MLLFMFMFLFWNVLDFKRSFNVRVFDRLDLHLFPS